MLYTNARYYLEDMEPRELSQMVGAIAYVDMKETIQDIPPDFPKLKLYQVEGFAANEVHPTILSAIALKPVADSETEGQLIRFDEINLFTLISLPAKES